MEKNRILLITRISRRLLYAVIVLLIYNVFSTFLPIGKRNDESINPCETLLQGGDSAVEATTNVVSYSWQTIEKEVIGNPFNSSFAKRRWQENERAKKAYADKLAAKKAQAAEAERKRKLEKQIAAAEHTKVTGASPQSKPPVKTVREYQLLYLGEMSLVNGTKKAMISLDNKNPSFFEIGGKPMDFAEVIAIERGVLKLGIKEQDQVRQLDCKRGAVQKVKEPQS